MKKLSNTETDLKKCLVYEKKLVHDLIGGSQKRKNNRSLYTLLPYHIFLLYCIELELNKIRNMIHFWQNVLAWFIDIFKT